MCLATLTMDGAYLTDAQIRNAWNANPDGAGFAYFDSAGRVRAFRTLELNAFRDAYARAIADGVHHMPMAVHFRLATHGSKTIANVHPFRMDANTLVIHNGMFPIDATGDRSDTCIFVEDTLAKLGPTWMDDENLRNLVEGYCDAGYTNKLVVLTDHPDAEFRAYIVNERAGNWSDDGRIWFSNRSHETPRARTRSSDWWRTPNETWDTCTTGADDAWAECGMCGDDGVAYLDETGTQVCYLCGTCQTCAFEWDDCTCDAGTLAHASLHNATDAQLSMWTM